MLKIRLRRMGAAKKPYFRLIVSDSRLATGGAAVEELGTYDPRHNPPKVELRRERIDYWLGKGVRLSDTVRQVLDRAKAAS